MYTTGSIDRRSTYLYCFLQGCLFPFNKWKWRFPYFSHYMSHLNSRTGTASIAHQDKDTAEQYNKFVQWERQVVCALGSEIFSHNFFITEKCHYFKTKPYQKMIWGSVIFGDLLIENGSRHSTDQGMKSSHLPKLGSELPYFG